MKNKKAILVFFIVVLVIVSVIFLVEVTKGNKVEEKKAKILPKVKTEKVVSGKFVMNYDAIGKISNNTYKIGQDVIRSKVSRVYVKEGDEVNIGDPLVSLDTTANVTQLNLQLVNTTQGINDLDLTLKQLEIKRNDTNELFKNGLISKNKLTELNNNIESLRKKREGLINTKSALNKQIISVNSLGTIYSNKSGIVSKVKIKPNLVPTKDEFIEIKTKDKAEVKTYLSEKIVKKINNNQEVKVYIDNQEYKAKIKEIYSLNDYDTLYPVDIEIDTDKEFLQGISLTARIPIYKNDNAILISSKSIISFNNETYVYRLDKDKVIKTPIKIGESENNMTEVLDGLKVGEKIVLEGQFGINNNDKVEIIK